MISFHRHDKDLVFNEARLVNCLEALLLEESKRLDEVSVILCSDDYLLGLNRTYLDHDYFTDILTFDYGFDDVVSGELYISVDRVSENCVICDVPELQEFARVVIHGFLHLCGYGDASPGEKIVMTEKENQYLSNGYI